MTAAQHEPVSSLLLIGELREELQRYLQAHVPTSAHWQVRSCPSVEAAMKLTPDQAPNLVVFVCPQEDALLCFSLHRLLEHAKRHWPYTFFVVVGLHPLRNLEALFARFGEMPVLDLSAGSDLGRAVEREMVNGTYGLVRGVSLPSFLQMLAWEQKSLSIRVESREGWGRLHLRGGRLVQAYSAAPRLEGEAAALTILSWETVSLRIERSYHNGKGGELGDVQRFLLDALRQKDEDAKREAADLALELLFDGDAPEASPFSPGSGAQDVMASLLLETDLSGLEEGAVRAPASGRPRSAAPNIRETLRLAVTEIGGAVAASLVDYHIGMALETQGAGLDFDVAAAAHTKVVRAQLQMMEELGTSGGIEDILITLPDHYHVISVVPDEPLFLSLTLSRAQGDPPLARATLRALGRQIVVA